MAAQGFSNKEIAEKLGLAYQTIKNNFHNMMKKLGAKNNVHALLLAMQSGMISIEQISDDMDKDLPLTPEQRKKIYLNTMKEIDKINKMSHEDAENYLWEQNYKALNIRKKKKNKE